MSRKLKVSLITAGIGIVGIVLLLLVLSGMRLYCPFNLLTGLQCPGCGNTRATAALFRLQFKDMLRFNLLYPLEIFYIARVYILSARNHIKGGRFSYGVKPKVIDIVFLVVLIIWTIVRNVI